MQRSKQIAANWKPGLTLTAKRNSCATLAGAVAVPLAILLIAGAEPARAQGYRGAPPGREKKPNPNSHSNQSSGTASTPSTVGTEARTFGVWLDDATTAAPRSVWVTAAMTSWSTVV